MFSQKELIYVVFCCMTFLFYGAQEAYGRPPDEPGGSASELVMCSAFYGGLGQDQYSDFMMNSAIKKVIKNPDAADSITSNMIDDRIAATKRILETQLEGSKLTNRDVYLYGLGSYQCPVLLGVQFFSKTPDDSAPMTKLSNHAVCVVSAEKLGQKQLAERHRRIGRDLIERLKPGSPTSFPEAISEAEAAYQNLSAAFHKRYVKKACELD